ncbi:MAG TPA: peptidylprolyl isomerase [Bryobacteraceae bacterium]|nr:peptidylprolyl isomerase [Bryobacteraceae bacterium]
MKYLASTLLFCVVLCGQTSQPAVAPGTPAPGVQAPPPEAPAPAPVTPQTVVAEVEGKKLTAAEVDQIFAELPGQYQQSARMNPSRALTQLLMFHYLAGEAEKANLDKRPDLKTALDFQRMNILYQAEMNEYKDKIPVTREDQEKLYHDNPDRFKQVKVKVIHLSFSATPDKPGPDGKKMMSEAEAKAKADELRAKITAGEDFGKLARENSDDKSSAAKDGDFGTISHNSPYPEPVKKAVFALKEGEVSEPVKQANGFYLIRADSVVLQPFGDVRPQIIEELKQSRFMEWMKSLETKFAVKVENQSYFAPKRPPQLQTVR